MAIKRNTKKTRIIFLVIAVAILAALGVIVYLLVFKTDKNDTADTASFDDLKEKIEEPVEETVSINPDEVLASSEYKDGIIARAAAFKADCAALYPDSAEDLARFSLLDIDKDGIPELIMHDVPGKRAYYCSYVGEGISEPFEIYVDESDDASYIPGAYAALYLEKNLFIKYVISGSYDVIESYLYKVNEETKAPELLNFVTCTKAGDGSFSYAGSDGGSISEDDYTAVFGDALGDDLGHYFLDELMIADGEYDFKTQYVFNSTPALSHMTYEEVESAIGQ